MMRIAGRMIAAAAVAGVLAGPLAAAPADTARMEEVVQSYVKSGAFMGSVLVWQNGQALLDKGYGFANLEWQVPNTPDSKYRIGSMTKQFTAAAIFLLKDRGKLSIDDPVKKYLPDIPAAWDKITIHNLLTHTAGIPNYTATTDFLARSRKPAKPEEIVGWVKDLPLEFKPGEKWAYSNTGYVLLGMIVEKVSGQSYASFLAENIFKPLGMKDTAYDSNTAVIAHHAYGYTPSKDGRAVADYTDMTVPFAAGALYSTTHDILLWDQALFGGKLLKPDSLAKMTTPVLNNYACGLAVQMFGEHRAIGHGGGIQGFNTDAEYVPDQKLAVIVLGNLNGSAPDELTPLLVDIALGRPVVLPSERKAVAIDPASFDVLAGSYRLAPQFAIVFTREGDHFFAQGTGQPKIEIFPAGPREFFAKVVNATFRFELDGQGKPVQMVLHQNDRDLPATREKQ